MKTAENRTCACVCRAVLACLACVFCVWWSARTVIAAESQSDLIVRVWGVDEGLPASSVTSVAQTPEGYLWLGTLYRGLMRFDGVRFVNYTVNHPGNPGNTPELLSMGVRRLLVDKSGRLWISTYANTLLTWDHDGFQVARYKGYPPERLLWSDANRVLFLGPEGKLLRGSLTSNRTNHWQWQTFTLSRGIGSSEMCADSAGRIWTLQSDQEIAIWQEGHLTRLSPIPGLENERVHDLAADALGRIWAGTDQSLARWDDGRFVPINPSNDNEPLAVKRLIPAGTSSIWVETKDRMRRLANGHWVAECENWGGEWAQSISYFAACGTHDGSLWWGGIQGLFRLTSNGSVQRLTAHDGLPSSSVRFLFVDRENNMWTGYERGPLVQIRPRLFDAIGPEQGLPEPMVNTVCCEPSGAVWIGTHIGAVIRYERGQCTDFASPELGRSGLSAVTTDETGRIFISNSKTGVILLEGGKTRTLLGRELLGNVVRLLLPARDGRLWAATMDDLWVVNGNESMRILGEASGPSHSHLAALAESADGTLWVGSFNSVLMRAAPGSQKFERMAPSEGGALGRFWTLCPTSDGSVWIGSSDGGLLRYRDGKFSRYTMKQGLPSDCITQVLTDEQENLWLGTSAGIARVAQSSITRYDRGDVTALTVSVFGKANGLLSIGPAVEFQPNCWRSRDGLLSFAMANSVAQVNPAKFTSNPIPPGVALEELRANGQTVWPTTRGAIIVDNGIPDQSRETKAIAPLRLGPGRQDLEFEFTALSFASPSGVRLQYQLEGLDAGWTEPQTERHATYRALGPGKYRFRVRASNSDGLWNENAVGLSVVVLPHYWQTAWFFTTLTLGLGLLAATAIIIPLRARHRRRLAQVKQQHALEQERMRVARDLHDDLGAGLAQIGLIGALAQRSSTSPERTRQLLQQITGRSRDLVTALDEIVWAVNPKHDTAASLSNYFCRYAQEFLTPSLIACRLDVARNLAAHPLDSTRRHQLFLAFKEALTNVVKHSGATQVWIRICATEDELQITVADNGSGLPAQAAGPGSDGVANMSDRLRNIGGRCEIQTRREGGTSVQFHLPIQEKRLP